MGNGRKGDNVRRLASSEMQPQERGGRENNGRDNDKPQGRLALHVSSGTRQISKSSKVHFSSYNFPLGPQDSLLVAPRQQGIKSRGTGAHRGKTGNGFDTGLPGKPKLQTIGDRSLRNALRGNRWGRIRWFKYCG